MQHRLCWIGLALACLVAACHGGAPDGRSLATMNGTYTFVNGVIKFVPYGSQESAAVHGAPAAAGSRLTHRRPGRPSLAGGIATAEPQAPVAIVEEPEVVHVGNFEGVGGALEPAVKPVASNEESLKESLVTYVTETTAAILADPVANDIADDRLTLPAVQVGIADAGIDPSVHESITPGGNSISESAGGIRLQQTPEESVHSDSDEHESTTGIPKEERLAVSYSSSSAIHSDSGNAGGAPVSSQDQEFALKLYPGLRDAANGSTIVVQNVFITTEQKVAGDPAPPHSHDPSIGLPVASMGGRIVYVATTASANRSVVYERRQDSIVSDPDVQENIETYYPGFRLAAASDPARITIHSSIIVNPLLQEPIGQSEKDPALPVVIIDKDAYLVGSCTSANGTVVYSRWNVKDRGGLAVSRATKLVNPEMMDAYYPGFSTIAATAVDRIAIKVSYSMSSHPVIKDPAQLIDPVNSVEIDQLLQQLFPQDRPPLFTQDTLARIPAASDPGDPTLPHAPEPAATGSVKHGSGDGSLIFQDDAGQLANRQDLSSRNPVDRDPYDASESLQASSEPALDSFFSSPQESSNPSSSLHNNWPKDPAGNHDDNSESLPVSSFFVSSTKAPVGQGFLVGSLLQDDESSSGSSLSSSTMSSEESINPKDQRPQAGTGALASLLPSITTFPTKATTLPGHQRPLTYSSATIFKVAARPSTLVAHAANNDPGKGSLPWRQPPTTNWPTVAPTSESATIRGPESGSDDSRATTTTQQPVAHYGDPDGLFSIYEILESISQSLMQDPRNPSTRPLLDRTAVDQQAIQYQMDSILSRTRPTDDPETNVKPPHGNVATGRPLISGNPSGQVEIEHREDPAPIPASIKTSPSWIHPVGNRINNPSQPTIPSKKKIPSNSVVSTPTTPAHGDPSDGSTDGLDPVKEQPVARDPSVVLAPQIIGHGGQAEEIGIQFHSRPLGSAWLRPSGTPPDADLSFNRLESSTAAAAAAATTTTRGVPAVPERDRVANDAVVVGVAVGRPLLSSSTLGANLAAEFAFATTTTTQPITTTTRPTTTTTRPTTTTTRPTTTTTTTRPTTTTTTRPTTTTTRPTTTTTTTRPTTTTTRPTTTKTTKTTTRPTTTTTPASRTAEPTSAEDESPAIILTPTLATGSASGCDKEFTDQQFLLTNPSYPDPDASQGHCVSRLRILSSNICQLRVEFNDTRMLLPRQGSCIDQYITVSGSIIIPGVEKICGINSDQHFYLDVTDPTGGADPRSVDFHFVTNVQGYLYRYSLIVHQIDCSFRSSNTLKAPRGCLQYFTENTGVIKTFNYEGNQYFNNMNYRICVRVDQGTCALALHAPDGAFGLQKANSRTHPINRSGVGSKPCRRDYLRIPDSSPVDGEADGVPSTRELYCGTKLSTVNGDMKSRLILAAVSSATYGLEVRTGTPRKFAAALHGPGFRLSYNKIKNCDHGTLLNYLRPISVKELGGGGDDDGQRWPVADAWDVDHFYDYDYQQQSTENLN